MVDKDRTNVRRDDRGSERAESHGDGSSTPLPAWAFYGLLLMEGRRELGLPDGRLSWEYASRVYGKAQEIIEESDLAISAQRVSLSLVEGLELSERETRRARRDMRIAARVFKLGFTQPLAIHIDVAEPVVRADLRPIAKRRLLQQLDVRARTNPAVALTVQDARRLVGEALVEGDSFGSPARSGGTGG